MFFSPPKASICPSKRGDISSLVFRAMITGTTASLINACVAGKIKIKTKQNIETSNGSSLCSLFSWQLNYSSHCGRQESCLCLPSTASRCLGRLRSTVQTQSCRLAATTFSEGKHAHSDATPWNQRHGEVLQHCHFVCNLTVHIQKHKMTLALLWYLKLTKMCFIYTYILCQDLHIHVGVFPLKYYN